MNKPGEAATLQTVPAMNQTQLRVRYAETDQMGIVHHANYLVWFEIGRVEWLRQTGFDYKRMEAEDDCLIAVVEASCRYKAPARYDDELIVQTTLTAVRGYLLKFHYRLLRAGDDHLLAEGETTHVVISRNMKRRNLPEKYLHAFQRLGVDTSRG
jgi:acyl-CoA thioester hydrolase